MGRRRIFPLVFAFLGAFPSEGLRLSDISLRSIIGLGLEGFSSKIGCAVNSGCPYAGCSTTNGTADVTLVNLTVVDDPRRGEEEEYHWMWSAIGRPVVQAAITAPGDVLAVDWSAVFGFGSLSGAVRYESSPAYSSAIMITKLIEYNDTRNDAKVPDNATRDDGVVVYDLASFDWNLTLPLVSNDTGKVAVELIARSSFADVQGKINLTLSGYSSEGFGIWLPHLSHSRRTNQVDIQLDGVKTGSGFNRSRFALELVVVGDRDRGGEDVELLRQKTTTLDDEHTPGIFVTEELVVPGIDGSSRQSYIQWRPVVYTTAERELSSSTGISMGEPRRIEDAAAALNNTMLYALYGPDLDRILVRAVNVSFGSKGDGFYKKTGFQAWTFTFGTGSPIRNGVSGMVVLAVAVLLTVVFLALVAASILCVVIRVKKKKGREPGYRRVDDASSR